SAPAATAWYLPKRPQLLRDRDGRAVFSLTLILERQPGPQDVSIAPLVQQGVVSLGLSLVIPLGEPAATDGRSYRPLFAQQAVFSLQQADTGMELASAAGMGTEAHVSLSAHLSRDQALGVLAALEGSASNLT